MCDAFQTRTTAEHLEIVSNSVVYANKKEDAHRVSSFLSAFYNDKKVLANDGIDYPHFFN